ncbi:hypothetical protein FHT40_006595 [Mycolicibacterium sp. BK556]|uniref:hypothetical protein n=1 Tax=Mycobacteriaceae TaxID=1762 RepID=UPI00105FDBB8|nr:MULTISPECIES: hypothetical protein [Mycobacteriaceae]MBB3606902.1 hypothetical protein [Mycolicibacterium sp. BK556]MBB3636432.1 hypothetical protein [Mycolicibacterium sp. BK607]MBB3754481.1 hypothetical protein [Mycolicibacterium sp. BK634]TDO16856.1 hypothetical protein EV580_0018 [Mycobacterium sp. BK086]
MRYVLRPLSLWARYFPQLIACYLLGLLGRHLAIEWAAWAGYDNDWWASLIMPLAGIARLGSYVAMLLVLRPAFPVLATFGRRPARSIDLFSTVIVPFFAIYLAWQMFREDWLAFESRALTYRVGDSMMAAVAGGPPTELHPQSLPVGAGTWVLIGGALVARWVLSKLKDRLPSWLVAVRLYVDALWVFLVLSFSVNQGLTILINPTEWIAQRRIMVWLSTTRADLFSHFAPLEKVWDAVMWALRTAFGGAAVPLIWLALAGIVYGVTLTTGWRSVAQRVVGRRADKVYDRSTSAGKRWQRRWSILPKSLREKVTEHAVDQIGKFRPITDSARIVLHAGVLALALYVLAYAGLAWLDMTGSFYRAQLGDGYLLRGMAWLLGPHPAPFWAGFGQTLSLVSHAIIEPLRICLIASTFAYCLEQVAQDPAPKKPVTAPAAP